MIITTQDTLRRMLLQASAILCLSLFGVGLHANELSYLPKLGNTTQTDHALSREVGDEHVFEQNASAALKPSLSALRLDAQPVVDPKVGADAQKNIIWDAIIQSNSLPLHDSERVQTYKQRYLEKAHFTNLMLERSQPYIAHLVKALDDRFLPLELALLPAVESGYQPHGVSSNNAVGLWQIVPITAREIGIERNRWFDGRADIINSTTAAIDYLSYLNAEFDGDWELTLAAYNAGPGRVRGAIRRNKEAGKPTEFASLKLPTETQNYIPKLVALLQLIKDSSQTAIKLPQVPFEDAFEVVDMGTRVSLDQLAKKTSLPISTLQALNPGLTHGVTPPDGPHDIYLPRERATEVQQIVSQTDPSLLFSVPMSHTVQSGDTLGGIALRYGMNMRELQNINHLDSDNIQIGQILYVVDSRFIEAPKYVPYQVASGDTLSEIAAQFSVSTSEIVTGSGKPLESDVIRPGDKLKIRVVGSRDG